MSLLVLSCLACKHDAPRPVPVAFRDKARFVLLTDRQYPAEYVAGWEQQPIIPLTTTDDPTRTCRRCKWGIQQLFPGHDWYIWMDASIELKQPPQELVKLVGAASIVVFRHPLRSCVYEELKTCRELSLDSALNFDKQAGMLRLCQHPANAGLHETGVHVSRDCLAAKLLLAEVSWWVEFGSRRDQLSFDPVLRRTGAACQDLPGTIAKNDFVGMRFAPGGPQYHYVPYDPPNRKPGLFNDATVKRLAARAVERTRWARAVQRLKDSDCRDWSLWDDGPDPVPHPPGAGHGA